MNDLKIFDHYQDLEDADRAWHKLNSIEQEIQRKQDSADIEKLRAKEKAARYRLDKALSKMKGE